MKTPSPSFSGRTILSRSPLVALALVLGLCPAVAQTTNSWNRNLGAIWQTASNWFPATVPNAADSVAAFGPSALLLSNDCIVGVTFSAALTITNAGAVTIGTLEIGTNANGLTINSAAGSFSFGSLAGSETFINIAASNTAGVTFTPASTPLGLADRLIINHNGGGNLTLPQLNAFGLDPSGVTVRGNGTGQVLMLGASGAAGPSTFVGSVDLESATVRTRVAADRAFGDPANPVNFTNNTTLVILTNFLVNPSRVFNFNGDATLLITNVPAAGFRFGNTAGQLTGPGKITKQGAGDMIVSAQNPAFTGPVDIQEGRVLLTNSGALGTNSITLSNLTTFEVLNGSASNSMHNVAARAFIGGGTNFLATLSRGVNLNIASNGIIFQRGANNANVLVGNLGTGSDLYFGLGGSISNNFTVSDAPGTTPWKGISTDGADRSLTNSIITAAGSFFLQGANGSILTLGNNKNGPGTVGIIASTPVTGYVASLPAGANVVRLFETDHNFSNVKFEVQSNATLALRTGTALGGSGTDDLATKATVEVLAGGILSVDSVTNTVDAINSDVTIRAGGILNIAALNSASNQVGLAGSGVITLDANAAVGLNNPQALSGAQFSAASINANHVVRLGAIDIVDISLINPAATFMLNATVGFTNETLNVEGGLLTVNAGNSRTINPGQGIEIGTLGATFGGVLQGGNTIRELIILCPVTATGGGPLIIGRAAALAFDGETRDGRVRFGNAASVGASVFPGTDFRWEAGELRFSGKGNSDAFVAGTLLPNFIIPPNGGQLLLDLTGTNQTRVAASRVVLNSVLKTNALRNIFVATNNLSTNFTLVCTNLIATNGSILAVDEGGGVNFVAGITLEGAEVRLTDGPTSDDIDFVFFSNPSGTPKTVIMGSTNDGSDSTIDGFVNGRIDNNITFEQLNGVLRFSNSLSLGTSIIVNNLGTNFTHPTYGAYVAGFAQFHKGRDGNPLNYVSGGQITVNLGTGEDIEVVVDEVDTNSVPLTNIFGGVVNILAGQTGVVRSQRGIDTNLSGTVIFNTVNLGADASLTIDPANGSIHAIQTLNLAGNASVRNNVNTTVRANVSNVSLGGNTLTIVGPNRVNFVDTISGGGTIVVGNTIATNVTVVNTNCMLITNTVVTTNGSRFGSSATFTGTIQVLDASRLEPGDPIDGIAVLSAAALDLSLNSTSVLGIATNTGVAGVGHDQISVSGTANLNGALQVAFAAFFPSTSNDSFTVVSAGTRSGTFTNAPGGRVDVLGGGTNLGSFRLTYLGQQVQLDNWQYSTNDADADSITDSWAQRYFNLTSLAAGTNANQFDGDADGDGVGNIGEFLAGTDPQDANSNFRITEVLSGPGSSATVRWVNNDNPMHRTTTYTLQYTDSLDTPYTSVVGATFTFPAPGVAQWVDDGTLTGGTAPLDLPPPTRRVYRVRAD